MESIIDQLRVHDGNLFKSESVLAVYVDFKRLVLDTVLLALSSPGGLRPLLDPTDEIVRSLVQSLITTTEALQQCVTVYATELRMQTKTTTREAFVRLFLEKMTSDPTIVSRQILSLDPIKQDFVCREIFRRCLVLFVEHAPEAVPATPAEEPLVVTAEPAPEPSFDDVGDDDSDHIRADDSASHMIREDRAPSVAPSVAPSRAPTVLSKVGTAVPSQLKIEKAATHVSQATQSPSEMSYKRPGIRRVIIDDDASTIMTGRRS